MGRPKANLWEKYKLGERLMLITAWCRNGDTDETIAGKMQISPALLSKIKGVYPEIREALKYSKEIVDVQVENALLKRALGYEYEEVTTEYEAGTKLDADGNPKPRIKRRTVTKKFIPPDTTAQIYWLKNRKPQEWREKVQGDTNNTLNQLVINCSESAKGLIEEFVKNSTE
jgi:hypothetical protein